MEWPDVVRWREWQSSEFRRLNAAAKRQADGKDEGGDE